MQLPDNLLAHSKRSVDSLPEAYKQWSTEMREQLVYVAGLSDFIVSKLKLDVNLADDLPKMLKSYDRCNNYRSVLSGLMGEDLDESQGHHLLRQFRNKELVYIAWQDFTHSWTLEQSLKHLSELAEAIICETYQWQYRQCCKLWGTPHNEQGEPQPMLIIGMGKLGGGELNFSSDIDLIFTYPENGQTQGTHRSISNAQFFTRLGQRVIKALDHQTFDGFCYRVDMRLRPFGDSGPLVMSFSALEDYYQEQGRDWERYAMVKARVMGEEMYSCYDDLRDMLRPFVYRRYIDFSAIQSLRRMKSMITSEVRRRGLENNIKIGAGGIREIEFIAQFFQLIRGGREPSLRYQNLLDTLDSIEVLHLMDKADLDKLRHAYCFLRRLEHFMQALEDKQTQLLPDDIDEQCKLAVAMGYQIWDALSEDIIENRRAVHEVFSNLIGEEEEGSPELEKHFIELWDMASHREIIEQIFQSELQLPESNEFVETIINFKQGLTKKTLGNRGREVINRLMPKVFSVIFSYEKAKFGLSRVLHLLNNIATRTTYLELLDTHDGALNQLVRLCMASPMISERLERYPILLDELIDPQHLYNPTQLQDYGHELRDFLARIPEDDMEQQMEALRQFKQISMLRIAAADITGALPVMKVSDHLTYLAEAIIDAVVHQAWRQMVEKYGAPTHLMAGMGNGFAVIGYGKLGGWELGYNSDLDLVFIHDCPMNIVTDGKKQIDGRQFYLKLAQRIIHLFSTRTTSGILYEVDTRLRPSGSSGLLVSPTHSFEEYQHNEAWTWEHQALVRARVVFDSGQLSQTFHRIRHEILSIVRDSEQLCSDVTGMRNKMYQHLGSSKSDRFDLKKDLGGITDIEFLAQFMVLKHSHLCPSLTIWSDNVRIFEKMADEGVIDRSASVTLIEAYTSMRDEIHHKNLVNMPPEVSSEKFSCYREAVIKLWKEWLE